jgi:hypothetical protein
MLGCTAVVVSLARRSTKITAADLGCFLVVMASSGLWSNEVAMFLEVAAHQVVATLVGGTYVGRWPDGLLSSIPPKPSDPVCFEGESFAEVFWVFIRITRPTLSRHSSMSP